MLFSAPTNSGCFCRNPPERLTNSRFCDIINLYEIMLNGRFCYGSDLSIHSER